MQLLFEKDLSSRTVNKLWRPIPGLSSAVELSCLSQRLQDDLLIWGDKAEVCSLEQGETLQMDKEIPLGTFIKYAK